MRILKHICFLLSVLVIFSVCLFSCSKSSSGSSDLTANRNTKISNSNTNQFDVAVFERNRELWTSKNIQNYKMVVGASGFLTNFPEEVLIEVKNRQTKSIKSLSKTGRNYVKAYEDYDTIEKIFEFVNNRKKAQTLNVIFDENFGYPNQIVYDGRGSSEDQLRLEVKSLEIIK